MENTSVVASQTESFLRRKVAPEVVSLPGIVSILFIFALLIFISVYSLANMDIYFSLDLYVTEDMRVYDYRRIYSEYFPRNIYADSHHKLDDYEYVSSPEGQIMQLEQEEKLQRCETCNE